jgi:hypothetical protein
MRRGEEFLRAWEWTWATAFVAGIVISFLAITTLAVIPSWMLYFSEQQLGVSSQNRLGLTIRDMVVTGWLGAWATIFVVTFYKLQMIRRRLRGEQQAERYSGGYR